MSILSGLHNIAENIGTDESAINKDVLLKYILPAAGIASLAGGSLIARKIIRGRKWTPRVRAGLKAQIVEQLRHAEKNKTAYV